MQDSKLSLKIWQMGFTLVELLIVVVILGILVTGVFVATNPLEQARKARDGAALGAAREFTNACERYYAGWGSFPAQCTTLEPAELRTGFCATVRIPAITYVVGDCSASFTPGSAFYLAKCSAGVCNIPGENL
ncbi:MAG: Uncharacterized protein LiPW16_375 [Microgenomates group bacterium LiPW_16]|nr:MAG: Uncharacterized protein LiPW16_375 [Microgenomates group bacterium LiPW_16]